MLSSSDGTRELDVRAWLKNLTEDAISRAAFGSSYEEGRQIFELLTEQAELLTKNIPRYHIPLWSLIYAKDNRRMREIDRMVEASLKGIIEKKEKAMKAGGAPKGDLLDMLLESNHKEIEEQGNKKNVGLSMKDVIDECELFYFADHETTSVLLAWTMMLLSRYIDWQARARAEVLQVFGNQKADFDGLSRLKIYQQECRFSYRYFCFTMTKRFGVMMLMSTNQIRFYEGISKAGKGASIAFYPFGAGPRICVGQNFALLEA